MEEMVLMGRERRIVEVPRREWEQGLTARRENIENRIAFMTEEHHRVRNFVVREIPNQGKPLSPQFIAGQLHLPLGRVNSILGELEKKLTFLVRDEGGAVVWAYPVTAEKTPHHATLNTGEKFYAA